jgi:hypothetical protein
MTDVRKTGGRDELDAIIALANAILVDLTAVRTALLGSLDRGQNGVLTLNRDTDTLADLTEIRTQVAAAIVDLGVLRSMSLLSLDRVNNALLGRTPQAKILADLTAVRTQVAAEVADTTAMRAAIVAITAKLDADAGVTDADYAATCDPAAQTSSAPAALTTPATAAGIVDGGTDGALATSELNEYRIGGKVFQKAATDDLFDLSGETDTAADKYRAYRLCLDVSGTATIVAQTGDDSDSAADALAALPAEDAAKCTIGVYVAGLSCDFDGVAGLAAQGDIHNGEASAVADPAALTASAPAALATSITVGIGDGGTAGNLAITSDVDFQIGGQMYETAETDDLWDLSAEVDTAADEYRAYRLYLDASGTATFEASTADAASAVLALAALPDESATKCPIAIFVAGLATDFDDVGGLAAQGALYDGRYSAVADPGALTAAAIVSVPV